MEVSMGQSCQEWIWWDRGSVGTAVIGTKSWADASCHDN